MIGFFRNNIARLIAAFGVAVLLFGTLSILLNLSGFQGAILWVVVNLLTTAAPIFLLAVLIEYLSRIAHALEKPGALGVNEEDETP